MDFVAIRCWLCVSRTYLIPISSAPHVLVLSTEVGSVLWHSQPQILWNFQFHCQHSTSSFIPRTTGLPISPGLDRIMRDMEDIQVLSEDGTFYRGAAIRALALGVNKFQSISEAVGFYYWPSPSINILIVISHYKKVKDLEVFLIFKLVRLSHGTFCY